MTIANKWTLSVREKISALNYEALGSPEVPFVSDKAVAFRVSRFRPRVHYSPNNYQITRQISRGGALRVRLRRLRLLRGRLAERRFAALRRRITSLGGEMNRARDAREGFSGSIPRYVASPPSSFNSVTHRQAGNIFIPAAGLRCASASAVTAS